VPVIGWVSIGVAGFGAVFTVVWWLIRRRVSRLDALEAAVFGDSGVNHRLHKFVTRDEFQRELLSLTTSMRGISEEGQRREERILQAIQNQTLVVGSEVRELKEDMRGQMGDLRQDVRAQAQRVDQLLQQAAK
jgi:hypothetical protein